jgi:hypothetical protein
MPQQCPVFGRLALLLVLASVTQALGMCTTLCNSTTLLQGWDRGRKQEAGSTQW